jgi:hypothetical protein
VEDFDVPIRPRREDLNTFVKLEPFAREYLALAEVQEKGYLLAALKEAGEEAGE